MRSFIILMTFLVLKTAVMPCGDEIPLVEHAPVLIAKSSKSQDLAENCNAFCNCSRCPFSVMLPNIQILVEPISNHIKHPATVVSSLSEGCFSIWQPPKLT